ncbi:MAG: hypothetical protein QF815_02465, partial [Candidatus Peribacteraceae bacterium]|nr:hypothetical protein [Candidatus Peribacteraceae bacterium]
TVDLRKILKKIRSVTDEVENLIMKPINVADHLLEEIVKYLDAQQEQAPKKKKKKASKKKK